MRFPVRPSFALVAAGLALSGCIDVECPAEFARPTSRERWCGHTGDVGTATPYRQYGTPGRLPANGVPTAATTTTTVTTTAPPAPMVQAAPPAAAGSVSVQPVPPPAGAPTQIR